MRRKPQSATTALPAQTPAVQTRSPRRTLVRFMLLSAALLLVGGLVLGWQILAGSGQSQAANSANVVGPPSLSAATVDKILSRAGSPMVGVGKVMEQASRAANVDDAFALGVFWAETNDGAAGVGRGDRNPGSVRGSAGYPAAFDGYTIYPSYGVAIQDWFRVIKGRYIARGLTTVYSISGPYVGTSGAGRWAGKVVSYMNTYRGMAPVIVPTPIPTPNTLKNKVQQVTDKANKNRQGRKVTDQITTAAPPQVNDLPQQPTTSQASAASSPQGIQWLFVEVLLLMAGSLAGYALWLGRRRALPALESSAEPEVALADAAVAQSTLVDLPLHEPITEGLTLAAFGFGSRSSESFASVRSTETLTPLPEVASEPITGGLGLGLPISQPGRPAMRRLILLPGQNVGASEPETDETLTPLPVEVGASSGGLLRRYAGRSE